MRYACTLPVLFAAALSLPAAAAPSTVAVEINRAESEAAVAVASACITNETDHAVTLYSNWGIGDRWARVRLAPGAKSLYRLVLAEQHEDAALSLRFPFGPGSDSETEVQLPTVWGDRRINDCSALPSYSLMEEEVDGEGSIYVLRVPAAG